MPYDKPTKKVSKHLALERDLQKLTLEGDIRSVFISIQGDPYDMSREDNSFTRQVLETFRECKYPFHLVTKGGTKAVRDFDLYKPSDKFGCTLTFDNPEDSLKWEPRAALPEDRIAALKEAHNLGIQTWASVEPVIYPEQSLHLIEMANDFVDSFSVGMLFRYRGATWTRAPEWPIVDWHKFRNDVEALMQSLGRQEGTGYQLYPRLIDETR
jgi:DNA repair photolyase